jgi:hypothetical protein
MWLKKRFDLLLFILLLLLSLTLACFLLGVLPYPFGLFILLVLIVARLLHLQGKH